MGKFLTSIGVATTFGPFLCTFLVDYVNYAQLFQIASIIPLIGLGPLLLVRHEDTPAHRNGRSSLKLLESLQAIVSSRNMLVLTYLRLAFSFTNAFFITLFALHAQENLLLASSVIALLFGIKGITNMLSRMPSGKLADKVGCRIPIIFAFTLLTITFLAIAETSSIHFIAFAMIVYGQPMA